MQVSTGKKISLRLDNDLVKRLEGYAARERVPVSYVLRHLVIRFLEQSPSPPVRPVIAGWRRESPDVGKFEAEFRAAVCALFDGFIAAGLDEKEATRRTNSALKERKHPWATYDVVLKVLRDEGRFRKVGRGDAARVSK